MPNDDVMIVAMAAATGDVVAGVRLVRALRPTDARRADARPDLAARHDRR